MANNAKNTNISYDAKLYRLLSAADAPESLEAEVPSTAIELGWLDEGGETFSTNQTVTNFRAHQSRSSIRNGITEANLTFAATFLEDNAEVRELYYGVKANATGVTETDGTDAITSFFCYDTIDDQVGYEKVVRYVFEATVTANGDIVYAPNGIATFPVLFNIIGKLKRMDAIA